MNNRNQYEVAMIQNWGLQDPLYFGVGNHPANSARNAFAEQKPARRDLTPRQIEWCRANISAFMPRVINAPR
jgi:hypothetical protein